ncbi:MAG: hypothetical protein R6W76_10975, partial [Caldilinea sp.]
NKLIGLSLFQVQPDALLTGGGCNPAADFHWSIADVQRIQPRAASWLYAVIGNYYYDFDALRKTPR